MRKRHYNSGSVGMRIATHACLDFNQALLGLQPRLTCTSIRRYLHVNQALLAMELSTFCYVPCNMLEIRWFV